LKRLKLYQTTLGSSRNNDSMGYNVDDDSVVFECEGSWATRNGINVLRASTFFLNRARFRLNPALSIYTL